MMFVVVFDDGGGGDVIGNGLSDSGFFASSVLSLGFVLVVVIVDAVVEFFRLSLVALKNVVLLTLDDLGGLIGSLFDLVSFTLNAWKGSYGLIY